MQINHTTQHEPLIWPHKAASALWNSRYLLLPSKQGPPPWQSPPLCHHELAKMGLGRATEDKWTAERKKKQLWKMAEVHTHMHNKISVWMEHGGGNLSLDRNEQRHEHRDILNYILGSTSDLELSLSCVRPHHYCASNFQQHGRKYDPTEEEWSEAVERVGCFHFSSQHFFHRWLTSLLFLSALTLERNNCVFSQTPSSRVQVAPGGNSTPCLLLPQKTS